MAKWKSIIQACPDRCYLCNKMNVRLEKHHIMNGQAYRPKAETDGLYVMLCTNHFESRNGNSVLVQGCHEMVTVNPGQNKMLKLFAQRAWIEFNHSDLGHWMVRYGKNYENCSVD